MMLLTPWPAIAALGIGAPLLFLMYILRLRRRQMRISSTVLWDQAVKDLAVNEPFRRFAPSIVFFLQLLALLAICAALGRPALRSDADPILGKADRIVIAIDVSASMRAPGTEKNGSAKNEEQASSAAGTAPRTRLEIAKQEALQIIQRLERSGGDNWRLPSGDHEPTNTDSAINDARPRAMLIAVGREAKALTGFTSDTRSLREAIESLQPTDEPLNIASATELIRATANDRRKSIHESRMSGANRGMQAIFLTDSNSTSVRKVDWRVINVAGSEGKMPKESDTATNASSTLTPSIHPSDNAGIVALSVRRDAGDPSQVRVFVRVLSTSPTPISTTLVCTLSRFAATDNPLGSTSTTRNNPDSVMKGQPIVVPAASSSTGFGEATTDFSMTFPAVGSAGPAGDLRVLATIELLMTDALASDNRVAAVVDALRSPRILLVSPGRGLGPDPFLLSALEATEPSALRVVDAATYTTNVGVATDDGQTGWTIYDLIVFDRVSPPAAMGTTVPRQSTLSFAAAFPPHFNLSVPPSPSSEDAGVSPPARSRVLSWSRGHAALRDVRLDTLVMFPALGLNVPDAETRVLLNDSASRGCTTETLALGTIAAQGHAHTDQASTPAQTASTVLIAAAECGATTTTAATAPRSASSPISPFTPTRTRHLLVGFALDRSNWGPHEGFPIFIANAIEWLSAANPVGFSGAARFEQTVTPGAPANVGWDPATALPINLLSQEETLGAGTRHNAAARHDTSITDNSDREVDMNSLMESTPASDTATVVADRSASTSGLSRGVGRELWPFFVLAAGLLLSVEWIVYAWQIRS